MVAEYQSQVTSLVEKMKSLEALLRQKDEKLEGAREEERKRVENAASERQDWSELRYDLEEKLSSAQNLNQSLRSELDKVRDEQEVSERELRSQIETLRMDGDGPSSRNAELEAENEQLKRELHDQSTTMTEVRREAQTHLREMRSLAERSDSSWELEQSLAQRVERLEVEVKDWRDRYARAAAQLHDQHTTTGLGAADNAARHAREEAFTDANGAVADVHITALQISVDDVLRVARAEDAERVVEGVTSVAVAVRAITADLEAAVAAAPTEEAQRQLGRLRDRVTATTNNLVTAGRNFAAAGGLSPVALLDAAASHLVVSVVELLRVVKIRPTPAGQQDDGQLATPRQQSGLPFLGLGANRESGVSSVYSPGNSPRQSMTQAPGGAGDAAKAADGDVEGLKVRVRHRVRAPTDRRRRFSKTRLPRWSRRSRRW
jgi:hypothetical protein